jgi:hypothetical protein
MLIVCKSESGVCPVLDSCGFRQFQGDRGLLARKLSQFWIPGLKRDLTSILYGTRLPGNWGAHHEESHDR